MSTLCSGELKTHNAIKKELYVDRHQSTLKIYSDSNTIESDSSDDNISLKTLQEKISKTNNQMNRRKRKQIVPISLTDEEPDDNSDFDVNFDPSVDRSSSSDEYKTPIIDKRRKKWVRKRVRPLKREQARIKSKRPKKIEHVLNLTKGRNEITDFQEALQKSKEEIQLKGVRALRAKFRTKI